MISKSCVGSRIKPAVSFRCPTIRPALRVVVTEHDVVLGIFPSAEAIGLHVIKGEELLRQIASSSSVGDYTHTAIAVHNREQAVALQQVLAA